MTVLLAPYVAVGRPALADPPTAPTSLALAVELEERMVYGKAESGELVIEGLLSAVAVAFCEEWSAWSLLRGLQRILTFLVPDRVAVEYGTVT